VADQSWIESVRAWLSAPLARPEHETARIGRAGERIAARHLRRSGYRVLDRNLRSKHGEIDLVCMDPDRRTIVFVEVKSSGIKRREPETGRIPPEVHLTPAKRRKLLYLAKSLAHQRGWLDRPLRIDAVAVDVPQRGEPAVRHYREIVLDRGR